MASKVGTPMSVPASSSGDKAGELTRKPDSTFFTGSTISSMRSASLDGSAPIDAKKSGAKEETKAVKSDAPAPKRGFNEMNKKEFDAKFGSSIRIATDEIAISGARSITSIEVGDCITIFGRDGDDSIFGYHIQAGTSLEEMTEKLEQYVADADAVDDSIQGEYVLFLIGGNDSKKSAELLDNIRKAIAIAFGMKSRVEAELINPNKSTPFKYISANIQLDGSLFFCRHND